MGRDHPRSRGVYVPITLMAIFLFGSSPLARGLPGRLLMIHHGWGIIPARAGFKSTSPPIRPGSTDHPRSRGVYFSHLRPYSSNEGSSPLARGLPKACISITFQPRIIPARAGFTTMPLRPITSTPDHPRSRGVYDLGVGTKGIGSGSSPLARGLLSTHAPPRPEPGIIPARAGFTIQIVSQDGLTRDHPRSRGVYQATLRCDVAYGGSSPLARGLRVPIHPDRLERRIIPARAGFTAWPAARSCTSWDHPRSRGVYT